MLRNKFKNVMMSILCSIIRWSSELYYRLSDCQLISLLVGTKYDDHDFSLKVNMYPPNKPRSRSDEILCEYPCSYYLHNALHMLMVGDSDSAYDEVCWAIIKSGGQLRTSEENYKKILKNERGNE